MSAQEFVVRVSIAEGSTHVRVGYRNAGEGRFSTLYQGSWRAARPDFDPAVLASSLQDAIRLELQAILAQ